MSFGSSKIPQLPPGLEKPEVTYRHEVNPAIALSLLSEIQAKVVELQTTLRKIVGQIQRIYAEGPVVDGWLESSKAFETQSDNLRPENISPNVDRALFRHADVDELMAYIDALESTSQKTIPLAEDQPDYRLCRLDEAGKLLSRPCPPEQVAMVSMAIARYQKLAQFVEQRQGVENQLKQIVDALNAIKQDL